MKLKRHIIKTKISPKLFWFCLFNSFLIFFSPSKGKLTKRMMKNEYEINLDFQSKIILACAEMHEKRGENKNITERQHERQWNGIRN